MNDPRLFLSDNPSVETQIALIVKTLGDVFRSLDRIEKKVDQVNGSVAGVTERQNDHDVHHGPRDANITERLLNHDERLINQAATIAALTTQQHDERVIKSVHQDQWKLLAGAVGLGAAIATILNAAIPLFS